jgi:hypothetical protein
VFNHVDCTSRSIGPRFSSSRPMPPASSIEELLPHRWTPIAAVV